MILGQFYADILRIILTKLKISREIIIFLYKYLYKNIYINKITCTFVHVIDLWILKYFNRVSGKYPKVYHAITVVYSIVLI